MYTVVFEGLQRDIAAIDRAQRRLQTDRRGVLASIGENILARGRADFETKSRGGTGSDGITWRRLHPQTVLRKGEPTIGVMTGQMINPARSRVTVAQDSVYVEIGADLPYSWMFSAIRPIFPKVLPKRRRRELEGLATAWGQSILDEEIG